TVPATRLAKGLPATGYFTPFTTNTPSIVIDDTDPLIDEDLDHTTIEQDGEDLTQVIAVKGTIEIATVAFDALAGIDAVDASVILAGPATYAAAQVSVGAGPPIGGNDYTTYEFAYEV